MRCVTNSGTIAFLACLLALQFALGQTRELPQSLGRLVLVKTLEGKDAKVFLDRLHQKAVAPKSSVTGEYRAGDKTATLYVSIYRAGREAREAGSQMMRLIKGGNRAFGHYSEKHRGRILVGRCVGMGQIHYLFQVRVRVFWLSIDPTLEQEALESLLKNVSTPNRS